MEQDARRPEHGSLGGGGAVAAEAGTLKPVSEAERIVSLDVLRGFALLGVFTANMAVFSSPLAVLIDPSWLADESLLTQVLVGLVRIFVDGKFITLFSILFGVGMVVQLSRAQKAGRAFASTYVRRLIVLAFIGLVHALLIWYGDILLMYAVAGVALLLFQRVSGKALLAWAAGLLVVSLLMFLAMQALGLAATYLDEPSVETAQSDSIDPAGAADGEPSESEGTEPVQGELSITEQSAEPDETPAHAETTGDHDDRRERWVQNIADCMGNPTHPAFAEAETIAYKEGPLLVAFLMRAITYAGFSVFMGILSGFGLRIIAVFLLGAALMKLGFFSASNRRWHWRCFILGVGIGLPLEVLVTAAMHLSGYEMSVSIMLMMIVPWISNIILCMGYIGGVCLLVHAGALNWLQHAFAAVGRMALTNYLLQSLIATFIFYWWGLALFGELDKAAQLLIVACVFPAQMIFSILWLHVFKFGPMEWLWRSLTYLKPQPMFRGE